MSNHTRQVCKHGTLVSQCRCIHHKTIQVVDCPSWCPTAFPPDPIAVEPDPSTRVELGAPLGPVPVLSWTYSVSTVSEQLAVEALIEEVKRRQEIHGEIDWPTEVLVTEKPPAPTLRDLLPPLSPEDEADYRDGLARIERLEREAGR